MWFALAILNVWACGADSMLHDWNAALGAVFLALVCWGLAEFRITPILCWLHGGDDAA